MEQFNSVDRNQELTQELAKELFKYNPETGDIFFKPRSAKFFKNQNVMTIFERKHAGRKVGTRTSSGNLVVYAMGKKIPAHRMAYLISYGYLPENAEIRHINGIPDDNRLSNLVAVEKPEKVAEKVVNKPIKVQLERPILHKEDPLEKKIMFSFLRKDLF